MDNMTDLFNNPPALPEEVDPEYQIMGPVEAPEGMDTMKVINDYVIMLMSNEEKFILHTYNPDGNPISIVWNGPGSMPDTVSDHIQNDSDESEPVPYITCKWFVPSQTTLNEIAVADLPDDYEFDKTHQFLHACMNPVMGTACSSMGHMPDCVGYSPEPIKVPVHIRIPGENREVLIQTARMNQGFRSFQRIEILDGETSIVKSGVISSQDLEVEVEELRSEHPDSEHITHDASRNSFLKGLIKV